MPERNESRPPERPDFMITLGLAPPYTAEDVKQAYYEKVKTAHPDAGGAVTDFLKLHEAFERATEFVRFRQSRLDWLAAHMEQYVAQSQVVDVLTRLGARVELEQTPWLEHSFGADFAQIMETVVRIHLCGPEIGDQQIALLVKEHAVLQRLRGLYLRWTRITDAELRCLRIFGSLRQLDVRGTRVATTARGIVAWFPKLQWLGIDAGRVSLLDRVRLRWSRRKVAIDTSSSP